MTLLSTGGIGMAPQESAQILEGVEEGQAAREIGNTPDPILQEGDQYPRTLLMLATNGMAS